MIALAVFFDDLGNGHLDRLDGQWRVAGNHVGIFLDVFLQFSVRHDPVHQTHGERLGCSELPRRVENLHCKGRPDDVDETL